MAGGGLARLRQPTSEPPYTAADLAPAAQQRGGEPDFVCPRLRAAVVGAEPAVPTPYIGAGPCVVVAPQAAKRSSRDCTFGHVTRCTGGAIVGRRRRTRCHDARVALPAPSHRTDHWNWYRTCCSAHFGRRARSSCSRNRGPFSACFAVARLITRNCVRERDRVTSSRTCPASLARCGTYACRYSSRRILIGSSDGEQRRRKRHRYAGLSPGWRDSFGQLRQCHVRAG